MPVRQYAGHSEKLSRQDAKPVFCRSIPSPHVAALRWITPHVPLDNFRIRPSAHDQLVATARADRGTPRVRGTAAEATRTAAIPAATKQRLPIDPILQHHGRGRKSAVNSHRPRNHRDSADRTLLAVLPQRRAWGPARQPHQQQGHAPFRREAIPQPPGGRAGPTPCQGRNSAQSRRGDRDLQPAAPGTTPQRVGLRRETRRSARGSRSEAEATPEDPRSRVGGRPKDRIEKAARGKKGRPPRHIGVREAIGHLSVAILRESGRGCPQEDNKRWQVHAISTRS